VHSKASITVQLKSFVQLDSRGEVACQKVLQSSTTIKSTSKYYNFNCCNQALRSSIMQWLTPLSGYSHAAQTR
jgi:transcription elongation factor Elf1